MKPNQLFNGLLLTGGLLYFLAACSHNPEPPPERPSTMTPRPSPTRSPFPSPPPSTVPTQTATETVRPTASNSPTPSPTLTPVLSPTPHGVVPGDEGAWFIIGYDVFAHPGPLEEELDSSLAEVFPEWVSFRQKLAWYEEPVSAGVVVDDASFTPTYQTNPAVTLVTVGILLDWQIPSDGDLFSRSRAVAGDLNSHFWEYVNNSFDEQARYPEVANHATYAIYASLDYDATLLEEWCETYIRLYGNSPLYRP